MGDEDRRDKGHPLNGDLREGLPAQPVDDAQRRSATWGGSASRQAFHSTPSIGSLNQTGASRATGAGTSDSPPPNCSIVADRAFDESP